MTKHRDSSLTYTARCAGCDGLLGAAAFESESPSSVISAATFARDWENNDTLDLAIVDTEAVRTSSEWGHRPDCAFKPARQPSLIDAEALP